MDDGFKFTGMFQNDYPNGFGQFILSNGDIYRGNLKNGKKHGKEFLIKFQKVNEKGFEYNK